MLSTLRARSSVAAGVLTAVLAAAPVAAQDQQPNEFQSWRLPGWTFTPGVIVGGLFDSNVAIAFPPAGSNGTASDKLFTVQPFGQLEYFSPRTSFSSGYQGGLRHYLELEDLDGVDHRAYFSLRHLVSRRVTLFATDSFLRVPTTDQLELNGVPFRRTGSRYNAFAGGLEARLSRTVDFTTRYDMTWVDFVRKDTFLTGGVVNGIRSSLSRRFSGRSSLGAEYGIRLANLEAETQNILFQEAGGVYRYMTGPLTSLEAAGGLAHLDDRSRGITRTGPYVRVGLTHRADRATLGLAFERSYVPSLSFGGTNESQEVRGYVQMPLARNRFYVQEAAAWRRTNPFVEAELPLDSYWVHTVVGYALQRWLRLEGYHSFTRQDTRVAAGQINRHVVGAQVVVSEPMRIR
jgi:hypothetical protein